MKASNTVRLSISALLLVALLIGCVGQQESPLLQTSTGGRLYISNLGDSSLLIYGDAINANGNLAPTEKIHDLRIQDVIRNPLAVFVDTTNDRLYVANTGLNQILIFDNASTINGNSVPDRVISGANTTLNFPRGLALDTTNNILYVSNTGSNAILVFDVSNAAFAPSSVCAVSGSTTTCNFTPTRMITGLDRPWGLFVDTVNDRLYAANTGESSILVFDNASNPATLTPGRTITFSNTNTTLSIPRLSDPSGLFVDVAADPDSISGNGTGVLYVANNGNNSILIFNNASAINGETIPDRVIDDKILVSGTSTGSNTATTLNDTTQSFIANQFVNFLVTITGGTGAGQVRTITANTATQLTVSPPWTTPPGIPDTTSTYQISDQISLSDPVGVFVDITADPDGNPTNGTGVLYVSNSNNSVLVFNNASTVNRNIVPMTISGTATTLSSPSGLFVDTTANALYVANFGNNSIVVFNNASTATGNIPPDRTILDAGAPLAFPGGIFADVTRDLLYVAEPSSILIFDHASTIQSTPPPVRRTIPLPPNTSLFFPFAISVDTTKDRLYAASFNTATFTFSVLTFNDASTLATLDLPIPVSAPVGLFVDSVRDLLYVSESGTNVIHVFSQASTSPTLLKTITDPALTALSGIAVDTVRDILYVTNLPSSILAFNGASTFPSSTTLNRTISGSMTTLSSPFGIFVDPENDLLYAANTLANSILVFDNASAATGNVAPSRTIAGLATTLNFPLGIFVDTTR